MTTTDRTRIEELQRIHRVVSLYYVENRKQSEIAQIINQSVGTVNRLIRLGREMGIVEITIRSPFETADALAARLTAASGLTRAVVAPTVSTEEAPNLRSAGRAAALLLAEQLRDGQTIAITGGKGVSALIDALETTRRYDVTVVPLTGGVQGKHYTDVNHLSTLLAGKLCGRAHLVHVPMFAASAEERDTLMRVRSCVETFELARRADIAIVGIGSVHDEASSYFDLTPMARSDDGTIRAAGAEAELVAHLLTADGALADYTLNHHVVSLAPAELARIPFSFSVATGAAKTEAIASVLRGRYLTALVTDERTAGRVVARLEEPAPPAKGSTEGP
ncbi:sugar-binding transcriptional regulator [Oceanicella sp. SM1341]|uniref:sugar-binding transcriptional regulator n=1 Tax=Oceanicella sp. SM1341 TaxID=1548889 RepID=UPI000E536822|nr:sugar-binding transcriptional regulator [Oceanicella sp. SM1341]